MTERQKVFFFGPLSIVIQFIAESISFGVYLNWILGRPRIGLSFGPFNFSIGFAKPLWTDFIVEDDNG